MSLGFQIRRDPSAPDKTRRTLDQIIFALNSLLRSSQISYVSPNDVTIASQTISGSTPTSLTGVLIGNGSFVTALNKFYPIALFDHFADQANGTTVETDLYSDTIPGAQLNANGEKLEAWYTGVTVGHATATRQIRVYFGGTLIYDSTAQVTATNANWDVKVRIIRETSSVVRCDVTFNDNLNLAAYPGAQYTRITGLTLSGTNILKITGTAAAVGAASGDITAKAAAVCWVPAA